MHLSETSFKPVLDHLCPHADMHLSETSFNHSEEAAQNVTRSELGTYISASQSQLIQLVNFVFLCSIISLLGMVGNVINMIVFYKQGLDTTINISFFSMAVSDFCCLLIQQWFSICLNPLFENSNVPMVPSEIMLITASVPREYFARITFLITVYITAERCLCITFPLKIKQMITPKRTTVIIILIYGVIFASICPLFFTNFIGWKFYPDRNRTLLGMKYTANRDEVEAAVLFIHAIIAVLSFLSVVVLTAVLIRKLQQKTVWRNTGNMDKGKSESMSTRDKKTSRTISIIAIILIACYAPSMFLFTGMFIDQEFNILGRHVNLLLALWSFAFLFEVVNSSVNILLYLNMSSKYRQTFLELFNNAARVSRRLLPELTGQNTSSLIGSFIVN